MSFWGQLTGGGEKTPAQQCIVLLERLESAGQLEDRREAIAELKELTTSQPIVSGAPGARASARNTYLRTKERGAARTAR